jgi:hypothetical protein
MALTLAMTEECPSAAIEGPTALPGLRELLAWQTGKARPKRCKTWLVKDCVLSCKNCKRVETLLNGLLVDFEDTDPLCSVVRFSRFHNRFTFLKRILLDGRVDVQVRSPKVMKALWKPYGSVPKSLFEESWCGRAGKDS